ncbi:MAG: hypothetical protein JWO04_1622 [Gammaproteobacteria bacterium]|nr:hypothetical protein [Gammaproteobacteria bacterium]
MTTQTPSPERTNNLADQAARSANDAGTLAERGADAVRAGIHQARDNAQRASTSASKYIKSVPIKSLVIAGAVGAALMTVVSLVVRPRDKRIERNPRNPPE